MSINNTSAQAADNACDIIEETVRTMKGLPSKEVAREAICAVCQAGGTNNAQGSLSVTVTDTAATPPLIVKVALTDIKQAIKSSGQKITLRQYARNRSMDCHDVGVKYDIPGDLAKKLTHTYGSLSKEDCYWASSFQMDSSDCPAGVKKMLVEHYNTMFRKS